MGGWSKAGGIEIDVLCLSRCRREEVVAFSFANYLRGFFFLDFRVACG